MLFSCTIYDTYVYIYSCCCCLSPSNMKIYSLSLLNIVSLSLSVWVCATVLRAPSQYLSHTSLSHFILHYLPFVRTHTATYISLSLTRFTLTCCILSISLRVYMCLVILLSSSFLLDCISGPFTLMYAVYTYRKIQNMCSKIFWHLTEWAERECESCIILFSLISLSFLIYMYICMRTVYDSFERTTDRPTESSKREKM